MGPNQNGEKMVSRFRTSGNSLPTPPNQNPSHFFIGRKCLERRGVSLAGRPPCRAEGDLHFSRNAFRQNPRGLLDRFPRRTVDRRQELRNVRWCILRVME